MEFDWDEHNLFHIAMHGISREDAESALTIHPVRLETEIRNGERRTLFAGQDQTGRILAVVVTPRDQRTRIVTAFPANKRLQADYAYKRRGNA